MAGDDVTQTNIPSIFLFSKEGSILKDCYDEVVKQGNKVNVAMSDIVIPLSESRDFCCSSFYPADKITWKIQRF